MTTKTKQTSLQLAALLTIAVLSIGTMQFAVAGGEEIKLEGREGDFKAKFEQKDERVKVDVSAENLNAGETCTITANTIGMSFVASESSSTADAFGEISVRHDTNIDKDEPDVIENDFGTLDVGDIVTSVQIVCADSGVDVTLNLE